MYKSTSINYIKKQTFIHFTMRVCNQIIISLATHYKKKIEAFIVHKLVGYSNEKNLIFIRILRVSGKRHPQL